MAMAALRRSLLHSTPTLAKKFSSSSSKMKIFSSVLPSPSTTPKPTFLHQLNTHFGYNTKWYSKSSSKSPASKPKSASKSSSNSSKSHSNSSSDQQSLYSWIKKFLFYFYLKMKSSLFSHQLGLVKWVKWVFGAYSAIKSTSFLHKDLREAVLKMKKGMEKGFPRTLKGMSEFLATPAAESSVDAKLEEIKGLLTAPNKKDETDDMGAGDAVWEESFVVIS